MAGLLVAQVGHLEGHAEGVGQSLSRLHLDLSLGLGLGALHQHKAIETQTHTAQSGRPLQSRIRASDVYLFPSPIQPTPLPPP